MKKPGKYIDIITKLAKLDGTDSNAISKVINSFISPDGTVTSKGSILEVYKVLKANGEITLSASQEDNLFRNLKKKFIRSLSGVTTVTVLTMPYPCPGKCIFCPSDVQMPKSYISSEPGAQRALANKFDPYLQTFNRLVALNNNGHPTEKIELIVLGGTWTFYPEDYRRWFIYRCFQALNAFTPKEATQGISAEQISLPFNSPEDDKNSLEDRNQNYNTIIARNIKKNLNYGIDQNELDKEHKINETAHARCVGLSVETRPNEITTESVLFMRQLGATKVQIGVQILDDKILDLNRRDHHVIDTVNAFSLLRQAGFKIQIHWMPNLLGSNPQLDLEQYLKLYSEDTFKPDEIKIYPCSLIPNTELVDYYKSGRWSPYDTKTLTELISDCVINTPRYSRITRIIRDIPNTEILAGTERSNIRQDADLLLNSRDKKVVEIRAREIKNEMIDPEDLVYRETNYSTSVSEEYFLEYVTSEDKLVGFLRLSFPKVSPFLDELKDSAIIREIHVYGQTLNVGSSVQGIAQHSGLGTKLIKLAEEITLRQNISKLAVISAIGTREYYRKKGFHDGVLYQHKYVL